jgi:pyridoxine 5-phosphate synthase
VPRVTRAVRLHVNVDHVATVRNARGTPYPDPTEAASACLAAGADGITAHLREDRRHIRDEDVERLRALPMPVFNLECAATDEMVAIAQRVRPDCVTLVPERREERTTEGGLEVAAASEAVRGRIRRLLGAGLRVSLFIAPDDRQVRAAHALGVQQIELHTGEYAHGHDVLATMAKAAKLGASLGLEIAAGHGLTHANVPALLRAVPEIVELNIGHAIVADALFLSLGGAVRAMREAMDEAAASVR